MSPTEKLICLCFGAQAIAYVVGVFLVMRSIRKRTQSVVNNVSYLDEGAWPRT